MSKYGDLIDADDQESSRQSAAVATVASKYNPDQYAKAIDTGSQLGVPAHVVAGNPEVFERPSKYGALMDKDDSPTMQEWLSSIDNAAVAQDDIESLSGLERALRTVRKGYEFNDRATQRVVDLRTAAASDFVKTPGMVLSGFGRLAEAGGRYTERGIRAVGGDWLADAVNSVETPWWLTPSEILKRPGQVIKKKGESIDVPKERQNLATDIAGGVGQLGAQTITQLLTGGVASAATLFGQGADIMGDRAEEAGATPEQTDAAVLIGASITALTERYGLDALLNRVPPQIKNAVLRQITDVAIGGGIEAAQEAVEGVLHNLTAKAIFDPSTPLFEGVGREATAAGGAGAIARAVMNAIVPGRSASFADQDRQTAEQISIVAQESKLATRSPQKLEELVAAIKAQTGTEFAYVDAEAFRTLYQSDQEAADAAAELTGSQKTYFEAAVSGTKMAIPLEKYVSKIAASKESAKLLDFVSFTADGMTAAEAKESKETFEARSKEIATQVIDEVRPDTSQSIYDDALGQLIATGMERSTAEKNAALTHAVFRTLGQRTGIDAQQLYQRYGLKVQREGLEGGTTFDQITPEQAKETNVPVDLPTAEEFTAAVSNTPAASVTPDGLLINLVRFQKEEQEGAQAIRTGVFYLPTGSAAAKHYKTGKTGYGGTEKFEGETLLRRPLFVKGSTGGKAPEAAYDTLNSKGAAKRLADEILKSSLGYGKTRQQKVDDVAAILKSHGAEPGLAHEIVINSTEGNTLRYAVQENIIAHAVRNAGYDSVVGYSKGKAGPFISEVFDVREQTFPAHGIDSEVHERFYQSDKSNSDGTGPSSDVGSTNGQPHRSSGSQADQDGRTTVDGNKPAEGWQTATRIRGKSGKPLRLYRGANRAIAPADFEDKRLGSATGHPSSGLGVFFTTDQADASRYGEVSGAFIDMRKPKLLKIEDVPAFDSLDEAIAWREKQKVAGHDGLVITSSHLGGPNWVVAFSPNQVIRELEQRFDETRRGAIQFGADRQFTISLLEKADLSTFIHESGHFYLEILADLAEDANAPQQVKDDFAKILKWMGVKDRASIQTDQHEQWARGFEAYLMEGKSPSVEMQSVFGRFRAWLVSVYRSLAKLNVNMTDDIRRVMDRLVATDEEIQAAEESQNYAPIFTNAEEAGMSPEEWAAYKDIAIRAHQEATQEMTDRALKELTREQKAWWKEERGKMVDAVTAEVNQQPVYRALAFLQKGQNSDGTDLPEGIQAAKLNKQALTDKYGKDFLKRLPKGTAAKDGISADVIAQMFGFGTGDALVEALANARPKTQLIQMEADARMREKYGDMLTDGSLAEQAMQSVHTDGRTKVMAAELKALNRKRREVKPFVKAAADTAKREQTQERQANAANLPSVDDLRVIKSGVGRIIQAKKVREIQLNLYRMAEAKAARKAFELAGKGKYEEAYQEKRRQILNHELYRAAVKAREEVDTIVQFMRGFDKKSTRERLAKAKGQYLEQIDALRERFDFSNVSNIADLKRDALSKWVAEQEAAGREVNVPEYLLNEARKTPYKELLLAELQGLHDAVKNIDHLARTKDRMMKNRKEAEWQDAKQELAERIEMQKGKAPPVSRFERSNMEEYGALANEWVDSWLRPETIVEWLDGGESGPWHDYLMEPANNAEYRRETLREQVLKPLRDLAEKVTKKRRAELHEDIQINELGQSFNRRTLLSIVLNMGNESNMDRLTSGGFRDGDHVGMFTPAALQEILGKLNAADVKFLNTAWATVEQLWPESSEFQKRMGGLIPEKIKAVPLQTKHGTLTGGYWPVVYDSLATRAGQKQAETTDPVATIMGANFARATTKKGHLKGRTSVAGPLLLDYSTVAGRHTEQVITDITHREFAMQAMRILDDGDLRLKLQDAAGETAWKSLRGMVRHTIEQDGGYSDAANRGQERIMRRLLSNTAVAALGFRAVTVWGNVVLAPIQAGSRIAPKYIALGIGRFYRHPIESTKFIHDSSEMMKQRSKNMDHTFNVVMETLKGRRGFRAKAAQAAMSIHTTGDFLATHGLWMGRYQEALDANESHDEAVRLADKSIRQTQTAGAPKDLSAFERDPRYSWFKMFLGPMLIQGNRIRESVGRKGVVKNWPQAFGTLTAAWFLPAILWDLMTGRGPDDDDDDGILDDASMWSLRKLFFYPFLTMPFIRDAASLIERKIAGQFAEPRMTPLADAGYLVYKAGQSAWSETGDWMDEDEFEADKVIKSGLRASGPLFGIPSNQIDVTGSYLYDLVTGEEEFENIGNLRYLAIRRDN